MPDISSFIPLKKVLTA